jgi:dTDP-glucose 4,6-dehydratase
MMLLRRDMQPFQVQKYPHYNFVNLDLLDTCATTNNLKEIEGSTNYTFVRGDIGNMDLVNPCLALPENLYQS